VEQTQNARTPSGCKAERQYEAHPDDSLGKCVLAPSLEHGYQSNEEKDDSNGGKDFQ